MGSDSLQLLSDKEVQSVVSDAHSRGIPAEYQGVRPALPADTWFHRQVNEMRAHEES